MKTTGAAASNQALQRNLAANIQQMTIPQKKNYVKLKNARNTGAGLTKTAQGSLTERFTVPWSPSNRKTTMKKDESDQPSTQVIIEFETPQSQQEKSARS